MRYSGVFDVIFSNSQPNLGTRSINGSCKFSEKKNKKRMTSDVRNGMKFGKNSKNQSRIVHENVKQLKSTI